MLKSIFYFFKEDLLFSFSLLAVGLSLFFGKPSADMVDFKVILCLFGLMLLIKNVENLGVLNYFAEKMIEISSNTRRLILNITLLSFFSSMLLTNDVAILTLMPIYLKITKKIDVLQKKIFGAVLLVIAANLGSSFFPFGNPQNLFLMSHFSLALSDFFHWAITLMSASLLFLLFSFLFVPKHYLAEQTKNVQIFDSRKASFLTMIFLLILAGVFDFVPYFISIPIAAVLLFLYDRKSFRELDYRLLATFVLFFIAVGCFSQSDAIVQVLKPRFHTEKQTFFISILLSQIISNVPAVILAAPFTKHIEALFYGVNVGGLGTLIASLANLIGFKIFKLYYPKEAKRYLKEFTVVNLIFLAAFILFFLFYI